MVGEGLVEDDRSTAVRAALVDLEGNDPKEERDDRAGTASEVMRRGGGGGRRGGGERLDRPASILGTSVSLTSWWYREVSGKGDDGVIASDEGGMWNGQRKGEKEGA